MFRGRKKKSTHMEETLFLGICKSSLVQRPLLLGRRDQRHDTLGMTLA